jgi:RNA polymerase sigma factor (sigma-70 family)
VENNSLHNEREVLLSISMDDQDGFRALVIHYRPQLLAFLITYTKSQERAEEIVQDVFMRIWLARQTLPLIKHFRGFLFVIAKNMALNAVRDQLREKLRKREWVETSNYHEFAVLPEDIKDELDPLEAAVASLPPQQKQVWIAAKHEGKKLAVIADEMNLSLNTVKKYIRYAQDGITAHLLKNGQVLLLIVTFWKNN